MITQGARLAQLVISARGLIYSLLKESLLTCIDFAPDLGDFQIKWKLFCVILLPTPVVKIHHNTLQQHYQMVHCN